MHSILPLDAHRVGHAAQRVLRQKPKESPARICLVLGAQLAQLLAHGDQILIEQHLVHLVQRLANLRGVVAQQLDGARLVADRGVAAGDCAATTARVTLSGRHQATSAGGGFQVRGARSESQVCDALLYCAISFCSAVAKRSSAHSRGFGGANAEPIIPPCFTRFRSTPSPGSVCSHITQHAAHERER